VNQAGTVVGWATAFAALPAPGRPPVIRSHAFRWTEAGGMVDLHPPGDTVYRSVAEDINALNLVVGVRYRFEGTERVSSAFVHGQGLSMTNLPGLCGTKFPGNDRAFAVNYYGWVVGGSSTCAGQYHATLWKVRVVFVHDL
jgi:uncharacterized membrane protein